ncbi:MAG TPA: hypothetical protein VI521_00065 [Candidatus Babeliales bacterium]|nr:hypothetical protein [Candidatus Babeliales bacterium]
MIKRCFLLLLLMLCLSNPAHAMQTSDNYLEALEAQFKQLTQAASDAAESDTDTSFLFNQFIHTQMALLLNGPDNMEELNQEIKRAHAIVLQNTAGHKVDPKLNAKVQQSKAKHTALFDFVRKHQNTYDVDPQLIADFKVVEEFTAPIKSSTYILHEGKALTADEFFALDTIEPANRDSIRIGILEQTDARAVQLMLEQLPDAQAIRNLPSSVEKIRNLLEQYRAFIRDYPDHEERPEMEEKLAGIQKLYDGFPGEYLKAEPSKKKIESISIASFLQKIGYRALQNRLERIFASNNPEEQLLGLMHIQNVGKTIRNYVQQYPTLEPEHSEMLTNAADRILALFSE